MKSLILAIVLLGLPACETKRALPPNAQAEKPLADTSVLKAEKPLLAHSSPVTDSVADAQPNRLVVVQERNEVCMVNDQYMGRDQIPVTIAGKTYYGCCPMCKGRLEQDATARMAKDPVTGNSVDKATAAIGRAPSGQVFYFE
ncbi:MAG TPA: hypothetical protein VIM73_11060, partial [Polyangiaceae bacterium]